jgi:pentatricopeptide repeat protein
MSRKITPTRKLALALTLFCLMGCVASHSRVEESHYMTEALSTAKRYDNLLRLLQKELDVISKRRATDLEGKLYVLDDLAFIYTHGLVDFRKAYEMNNEAKAVLEEIQKKGIKNLPLSPYFNQNRSLYYYLYPGGVVSPHPWVGPMNQKIYDGGVEIGDVTIATKEYYGKSEGVSRPYVSLASAGLLDFIRERDIQLAKERIEARERFLSIKLGFSKSRTGSIEKGTMANSNEAKIIRDFLEPLNIYNDYYLNFHRAARLWHLAYTVDDPTLYSEILMVGEEAMSQKDSLKLPDDYRSIVYLNYWTGISALKLHQNRKGIAYLEAFSDTIDLYEDQEVAEKAKKVELLSSTETKRAAAASGLCCVGCITIPVSAVSGADISGQFFEKAYRISEFGETEEELQEYHSKYATKINRFLDKYSQLEYFFELAKAYEETGDIAIAINYYQQAIEIVENQRSTIYTEKQRISYFERKFDIYSALISLLVKTGKVEEAFRYVERSKSRALVDILGQSEIVFAEKTDKKTYDEIILTHLELDTLLADTSISPSQNEIISRKIERSIKVEPKESQFEIASLANVTTVTSQEAREMSKGNFDIIEYFLTDQNLFIFVISKGEIRVVSLSISKVQIDKLLLDFRAKVVARDKNANLSAKALYHLLIVPIKHLLSSSKICIVPHSTLHYLPFQALYDGNNYLIQQHQVFYAPSVTVLRFCLQKRSQNKQSLLAIGPPPFEDESLQLKFAESESYLVSTNFEQNLLLLRNQANESNFRKYAGDYDIVHIATHGYFSKEAPMKSYLLLLGDQENDGKLSAYELFGIKLHAYLVTLSACQTAVSRVSRGDEMLGLVRGLIYAGTPSIVASLWNVDDASTAELMNEFYSNLTTMDKAEALQYAQLEIMQKKKSPFFWAPFILIGDYF